MEPFLPASVGYLSEGFNDRIEPGGAIWKTVGRSPYYGKGAVLVTAIALDDTAGLTSYRVLKVDDVNITLIDEVIRDEYELGFNITNNGSTAISSWVVHIGLIGPEFVLTG